MPLTATFTRIRKTADLKKRLNSLAAKAVYVGIPASSANDRQASLLQLAGKITGKSKASQKKKSTLERIATKKISNAELLFIFSKGSPRNSQPARPVLEPAIQAAGNREAIAAELAAATKATLEGKGDEATRRLKRAGVAGANAARAWFTNPENGWQNNAPSTIQRKLGKMGKGKARNRALAILGAATSAGGVPMYGSSPTFDSINTPGIDTGQMRKAITWVLGADADKATDATEHATTTKSVDEVGEVTAEAKAAAEAGVVELV